MAEIRGLSVRQPWAWAIAHAGKDVENRTWATTYEGLLAIHASKTVDRDAPTAGRDLTITMHGDCAEMAIRIAEARHLDFTARAIDATWMELTLNMKEASDGR